MEMRSCRESDDLVRSGFVLEMVFSPAYMNKDGTGYQLYITSVEVVAEHFLMLFHNEENTNEIQP